MAALESSGPDRFAMVTPGLYRGGAPSADDLQLLQALGVTKIVDLRREDLGKRRAEHAAARQLGIHYVEYPFYGVFGTDTAFLDRLVAELDTGGQGAVYVHCSSGRDRTSLAVALYRVVHDGWSADLAWEREALAYGHKQTRLNRELELTFQDFAYEQTLRRQTATSSGSRVRAVSAAFSGPTNGALVQAGSEPTTASP
jgi:protein tyrosine/serine phosphatase